MLNKNQKKSHKKPWVAFYEIDILRILQTPFFTKTPKENEDMHIAVAGNIGAGKTTLTTLLSKHYRWEAHFEDVVDNPYLDDFYTQMERWSFNLQIYFLNSRFRQILKFRESGKNVIQDRTIDEDAHIFAPNLHAMGLMTNRDFEKLQKPL